MTEDRDRITINGRDYVALDTLFELTEAVIVRTRSAGVFAGHLSDQDGMAGRILNARRLWYWDGAASLSELATKGPSKPQNCKFPTAVPWIDVTEIIEVLPLSSDAMVAINAVPVWSENG